MRKRCALNIISGQLGAGKTTLLKHLLQQKPDNEHWMLLVNEFGAVGIDGPILESTSQTSVTQIPGGCICCTAKSELETTALQLLDEQQPDRLLIEPTGLGEPDSLVDLFTSGQLAGRFDVQTLFSVFDLQQADLEEFDRLSILQSLFNMADVIVLNKKDAVSEDCIRQVQAYCEQLYPPKQAIYITQQAQVPLNEIRHPHFHHDTYRPTAQPFSPFASLHTAHAPHAEHTQSTLPYRPLALPNLLERVYQTQLDTQAIGWVFDNDITFDWAKLFQLLESLGQNRFQDSLSSVKRAKGVFRVGSTPRMLFQWVNGQATREFIAYRKDSRLELLLDTSPFDFPAFEKALQGCIKTEA
jgi:Putative GTPases (G3E family)